MCFVLPALIAGAQPTITSSVAGEIGDNIELSEVNATGFDPGATGADVTWDFSGVTTTGTSFGYTLIDPAATGVGGSFPGANVAGEAGVGNYAFFKITSTEYSNYGVFNGVTTIYYSDPENIYTFPLTYNSTGTDNLYSEFTSGVGFIRSGSTTFTADGYGTLILPSGTYTNVLRVLVHETYGDEAVGVPMTIDYDFKNYYWLKAGTVGPLFEYFDLTVTSGGFPSYSESAAMNDNIVTTGVEDISNVNIQVFPNPAVNYLVISGYTASLQSVQIFDAMGRMVKTISEPAGDDHLQLDVSDLAAGIYTVQLNGDHSVAKQFSVIR